MLIIVQLYASRLVINALGFDEYGLYSLVGAIIVFLGFINISMAAASQRFLAYSHGKDDLAGQKTVFNSVAAVQVAISTIILLFAEIGGIIYIKHFLNVPAHLTSAAHIIFQISLAAFLIKTLTVPFMASIIANERMKAFAVFSLIEGGLQFGAAVSLPLISHNRLILYAAMMAFSVFAVQTYYICYCRKHFPECRITGKWDNNIVRKIFGYSGWNLMGSFSSVAIDQGVNMILNSFFGVVINATRGIAFQVSGGIASLSGNFQQAINPQIVKTYAGNNIDKMHYLIGFGTRLCYFLLIIFSLPIYFNITPVLSIWLGKVPPLAEQFCRLVLINSLINSLSGCIMMGAMATGNIRKYQLVVASINLLNLPLSIIALLIWPDPLVTMYIMIGVSITSFFARLYLLSGLIRFPVISFLKDMARFILVPTVAIIASCILINLVLGNQSLPFVITRLVCMSLASLGIIWALGMKETERLKVKATVRRRLHSFC